MVTDPTTSISAPIDTCEFQIQVIMYTSTASTNNFENITELRRMKKILMIILLNVVSISSLFSQGLESYLKRNFVSGKDTLPYRILYPENYNPKDKYPLLLFLHGSGERGNDNEKQLVHGGRLFLRKDVRVQFPAIVIFPQCPTDSYWSNVKITTGENNIRTFNFQDGGEPTKAMELLMKLFENLKREHRLSRNQLYVGGLSMGGMGTFELLNRCPKEFAAAFPICGGANPATAKSYSKRVPLWIFHGEKDNVVPVSHSLEMAEAIRQQGGNVKLTIYPEANHNSWDSAFAEPELLPWLFSKKK